mgnify:CR=1 FL=1
MRVSLNWLQQFIHLPEQPQEVGDALTRVGLEVEGIDTYHALPPLEGLFIGKVQEAAAHPDAERLKLTRVKVGPDDVRQIVCGAPNVRSGQHVVVALPGTTLHPFVGAPFKIKKGKIRGQVSEGMICAEDEIGLGPGHDGIMVLPESAPVGSPLSDYLDGYQDVVFEIGLTPNRIDAANHLGVARDLSAWYRRKLCRPERASLPKPDTAYHGPTLSLEAPEACPRYAGLYFPKVIGTESPEWLRRRLAAIGIQARNIWVDVTNYVMHEMGQPLHAFDGRAISGHTVRVRWATEGEPLETLDGVQRKLRSSDLVIANDEVPMALAGIMGGQSSGVQPDTTSIFLESAYFEPTTIRASARHYQLHTDASFRYERGADPYAVPEALERALWILKDAGAIAEAPQWTHAYPQPLAAPLVDFEPAYLERLAGQPMNPEEIREILHYLEFDIQSVEGASWRLSIPTNKPDVTRPADVAEEVLRIYGYDHIHFSESLHYQPGRSGQDALERFRSRLRTYLADQGGLEAAHNSIVNRPRETSGADAYVDLANPLTAELNALRTRLLESGLESLRYNVNRQQKDLLLFELGRTYRRKPGGFEEKERLGLWLTGRFHAHNWHDTEQPADVYHLKAWAERLLAITDPELATTLSAEAFQAEDGWHYGQRLRHPLEGFVITYGKVEASLLEPYDIEQEVFFLEADIEALFRLHQQRSFHYQDIPRFPAIVRDLALEVPEAVPYEDIRHTLEAQAPGILQKMQLFDRYTGAQVTAQHVSYGVRLTFQDPKRTLKDKHVDQVIEKMLQAVKKRHQAIIRS